MGNIKCAVFLITLGTVLAGLAMQQEARAIGASPINGGCYIAAPGQCKIHIEPFTLHVFPGESLVFFQLKANNHPVYTFVTDNSNPPIGAYVPSGVMQDFAATCGTTYFINIIGQDTGDPSAYNLGSLSDVVCPATVP